MKLKLNFRHKWDKQNREFCNHCFRTLYLGFSYRKDKALILETLSIKKRKYRNVYSIGINLVVFRITLTIK